LVTRYWNEATLGPPDCQLISGECDPSISAGLRRALARAGDSVGRGAIVAVAFAVVVSISVAAAVSSLGSDGWSGSETANAMLVQAEVAGRILNAGQYDLMDDLIAEDATISLAGAELTGPSGMQRFATEFAKATPVQGLRVDNLDASGDLVQISWTLQGAERSELLGLFPTADDQIIHGRLVARVIDGKVDRLQFLAASLPTEPYN
jgi:SnoaL-like domain